MLNGVPSCTEGVLLSREDLRGSAAVAERGVGVSGVVMLCLGYSGGRAGAAWCTGTDETVKNPLTFCACKEVVFLSICKSKKNIWSLNTG